MEKEKRTKTRQKITDAVLKTFKLIIFGSFLAAAAVMYKQGHFVWGNDLVLTAALLVALNKLDHMEKKKEEEEEE